MTNNTMPNGIIEPILDAAAASAPGLENLGLMVQLPFRHLFALTLATAAIARIGPHETTVSEVSDNMRNVLAQFLHEVTLRHPDLVPEDFPQCAIPVGFRDEWPAVIEDNPTEDK